MGKIALSWIDENECEKFLAGDEECSYVMFGKPRINEDPYLFRSEKDMVNAFFDSESNIPRFFREVSGGRLVFYQVGKKGNLQPYSEKTVDYSFEEVTGQERGAVKVGELVRKVVPTRD